MDINAAQAAIRFGLGRTPAQTVGADPQRWLAHQLTQPDPGPRAGSVGQAFEALIADRDARRPQPGAASPRVAPSEMAGSSTQVGLPAPTNPAAAGPSMARGLFRADSQALLDHAIVTSTPFRERLVWFWANHFTVSTRRGMVAPLAGAYVRDAIRPYVTGRFTDMLLAVMRHPAMLMYLDNAGSAGPHSLAAARGNRGLNENLARECLELHTVSPASGFTQTDVTEFARVLAGWSIDRDPGQPGFRFRPALAEPGDKTLLGRHFPEGEAGGALALQFLAEHPATHRHLATKLVRHFVDDTPPPDAIRRIEGVLRDTRGNLGAAALELTRLPAAWRPLTKVRTPQELVVAAFRAADVPPDRRPNLMQLVGGLGQPLFGAPFPIGWPDVAAEWAGPEALLRRIDWAYGFANRPELAEPAQFAEAALGPLLSEATATEIRRAGSRRDGITLLLASPEFTRR